MPESTRSTTDACSLLTMPDVARHCQVSVRTVRRWIERGDLVAIRLGRQWRISRADFDVFLAQRRCLVII